MNLHKRLVTYRRHEIVQCDLIHAHSASHGAIEVLYVQVLRDEVGWIVLAQKGCDISTCLALSAESCDAILELDLAWPV